MDAFIQKHLEAWLDRHVSDDEREEAKQRILSNLKENPEILGSKSWREIHDFA